MKKRLISILCIVSILLVWMLPAGAYAGSGTPDEPEPSSVDLNGSFISEGLDGIQVDNAEEALALLTGGIGEGHRGFDAASPAPTYTLTDTVVGQIDQGKSYKFQQTYHGIPIYGMVRIVNTDKNGYVQAICGDDDPDMAGMKLPVEPVLSAEQAVARGKASLGYGSAVYKREESELCYFMKPIKQSNSLYHLAYRVVLSGSDEAEGPFYRAIMIDAIDGGILDQENRLTSIQGTGDSVWGYSRTVTIAPDGMGYVIRDPARDIQPWDMAMGTYKEVAFDYFSPTKQFTLISHPPGIDGAYHTELVYDYYEDHFGWDSMDGAGTGFDVYVNYGFYEDNAFYDGVDLTFGSGNWEPDYGPDDATVDYCAALDVVAHEFTHGVTDNSANLAYRGMSGALNEAFSDIMGTLVEDKYDEGFYLLGEDVMIYYVLADMPVATRNMKNPSKYGMPSKMSQYKHVSHDNGGVHINCSIPCKAFYQMSLSLSHEQLAYIWFGALTQYLTPFSDFWDARNATIAKARSLYGSSAASVVESAWNSVGVTANSPDAHGNDFDTAWDLASGASVSAKINWGGDYDFFRVTPVNSGTYSFYTTGSTDTYGFLTDDTGWILNDHGQDDDRGSKRNFKTQYDLEAGQTYYVVISHYNELSGRGSYALRCDADIPPVSGLTVTPSRLSPQEIGTTVRLSAAATYSGVTEYQFQVKKSTTSRWTTLQAYGQNRIVDWTPEQVGNYNIRVWARAVDRNSTYDREYKLDYELTYPPSLDDVGLATSEESPRESNTAIILTAAPEGAPSETSRAEYLFRVKLGRKWTTLQNWSSDATCEWIPDKVGAYTLEVQARTQGRPGTDAKDTIEDYEIVYPPALDGVLLDTDLAAPQERNTAITLAATPQGDESETSRAEYLFRAKQGRRWTTLRSWSDDSTYEWVPAKTGTYTIEVQARTRGRITTDHTANTDYTVVDIYPLDGVDLESTPGGMREAGTVITLTATAQGPHADTAEYAFQYSTNGKKWYTIRSYSSGHTVTYTPTKEAEYQFRVQARSPGRTSVDQQAIIGQRFYIGAMPVEDVDLTAGPEVIQETNHPVTLTATAIGDAAADAEYLYRIKLGRRWTTIQNWTSDDQIEWTPGKAGAYTLEVQTRTQGRRTIDATDSMAYAVEDIFPLTDVALTGSPNGMQAAGTEITLTATAQGPHADTAEYAFQYSTNGKKWYTIRSYDSGNAVTYTPAKEAEYRFRVQARSAGRRTADEEDTINQRFYVGAMPVESVSLSADPADTQENGAAVMLTAMAMGDAAADAEYMFRVKSGRKWTTLQDWDTDDTYEWTPGKTGIYVFEVQARTQGRSGNDAIDTIERYTIVLPPALDAVSLSADRQSPSEIGTDIVLTATAQGEETETSRAEYLFRVKLGRRWSTLQNWSSNPIYVWTPDKTGTYTIEVQARTQGRSSADDTETITGYQITLPPELTGVELVADKDTPQENGTAITLTATPQGEETETSRAEYLFRVKLGRRWSTLQNWSDADTYVWTPTKTGTYTIEVQARTQGRSKADDTETITGYQITLPPELTGVELAADKDTPQENGTAITLTATPQGAETETSRAEYLFRVKLGRRWSTLQNWSTNPICVWTPTKTGTYTIEVQARTQGRSKADDTETITGYQITLPPELTGVELAVDKDTPQENGTAITLTATPQGAETETSRAEYLFRVKLGRRWSTLQNWSTNPIYVWTPTKTGTYTIEVQARTQGRSKADDTETITGYQITLPPELTGVELAADKDTPQENGTAITLTATPQGAETETSRAEYLFRVKLGRRWSTLQNWSDAATYTWTPAKTGTYTIEVQARTQGRSKADDTETITGYQITLPPELTGVELVADKDTPQENGTAITLTATAQGAETETSRAEYLFRVKLGRRWSTLQNWSTNPIYVWTPDKIGTYTIEVQARTQGRSKADDTETITGYQITLPPELTGVELAADKDTPQENGETITLTAAAQGEETERSRAEYLFRVKLGRRWSTLQNWSDADTCTWTPTKTGTYTIEVQARTQGRSKADDTETITGYQITLPPELTGVELAANKDTPQENGETITLTAAAQGEETETSRAEYLFRVKLGKRWSTLQNWSDAATCTWTPTKTGTYTIEVQARTQGRTTSDTSRSMTYVIAGIIPVTNVTLAADPQGYAVKESLITVSAEADRPHAEYQFLVRQGGDPYEVLQSWSTAATCEWTPAEEGLYTLLVLSRARQQVSVQATQTISYRVLAVEPVRDVTMETALVGPQELGTVIEITAQADQPDAEYQFAHKIGDGDYTVVQDFSTDASFTWHSDTAGVYAWRVRARTDTAFPEGQAERQTEYGIYTVVAIPDAALRTVIENALGKDPGDMITSLDMATLPALNCAGLGIEDLTGIEYGVNLVTLDISDNAIADLVPMETLLANGGLSEAGSQVDITLNGLDCREGTSAKAVVDTLVGAGVAVDYLPQHPVVSRVMLTADTESPQDVDTAITFTATADQPGVAYRFAVDDVVLQDWSDANTVTWTPNVVDTNTVTVQARTWGMPETAVEDSMVYEIIPQPLSFVDFLIFPNKCEENQTVRLYAGSDPNAWYRFEYMTAGGEWTLIQDWTQETMANWVPTLAGNYSLRVLAHRDGRPNDWIDVIEYEDYTVLPTPLTGQMTLSVSPESPQEAFTLMTISVTDMGPRAEYQFAVQAPDGTWAWIGEWGTQPSTSWVPAAVGVHTLYVRARNQGREEVDIETSITFEVEAFGTVIGDEYGNYLNDIVAAPDGGYVYVQALKYEKAAYIEKCGGTIQWSDSHSGANTGLNCIINSPDGYIAAGYTKTDSTESPLIGIEDGWIIEYSPAGSVIRSGRFGEQDYICSILEIAATEDGGWIFVGRKRLTGVDTHGWVCKIDAQWDVVWEKTISGGLNDDFSDVCLTEDGGALLGGVSQSDYTYIYEDAWLVKIDENGNEEWQQTYDYDNDFDYIGDIAKAQNEGYIISVYSYSYHNEKVSLKRIDSSGNILFDEYFGGTHSDHIEEIIPLAQGGYICFGTSNSRDGDLEGSQIYGLYNDFWLMRLDNDLTVQWSRSFGVPDLTDEGVAACVSGGVVYVGGTRVIGEWYDEQGVRHFDADVFIGAIPLSYMGIE